MPLMDRIEGRFSNILPPNTPLDEHRLIATAMLAFKGVNLGKPVCSVRFSGGQRDQRKL